MDVNSLFNNTIHRLQKNLDIRSKKHDLIVSNIANKDTPGYKAFDLLVEEAVNKPNAGKKFNLTKTHPQHRNYRHHKADDNTIYQLEKGSFSAGNKENTVDLDREMGKLSENSLLYNVTAHIISKKINSLKSAISGGKK